MHSAARFILLCTVASLAPLVPAQQAASPEISADAIMARVAANQDRSEDARSHYVYIQHARVSSRKGKTVMCEEVTDSRVAPSAQGSESRLIKLEGRLLAKHKYMTYTALPASARGHAGSEPESEKSKGTADDGVSIQVADESTDRDLVESMRESLTDNKSRDGVHSSLFPFSTMSQAAYQFQLLGRERMNGRNVFHIAFRPESKDDFGWKGDAYIDTETFQPVVVSTDMARKVPMAVRTLLGTNVPGLGFTIVYAPQPDGVWFPVNLSTEFKLHVLFFFSRDILIDAQNTAFEKTHVTSRILDAGTADASPVKPD